MQATASPGISALHAGALVGTSSRFNFTGCTVTENGDTVDVAIPGLSSVWFNVRDYGAAGDGTTDDTDAIRTATLAAVASMASAKTGTVLFFPPGAYLVSSTIQPDLGAVVSAVPLRFTIYGPGAALITPDTFGGGSVFEIGTGTVPAPNVVLEVLDCGFEPNRAPDGRVDGWLVIHDGIDVLVSRCRFGDVNPTAHAFTHRGGVTRTAAMVVDGCHFGAGHAGAGEGRLRLFIGNSVLTGPAPFIDLDGGPNVLLRTWGNYLTDGTAVDSPSMVSPNGHHWRLDVADDGTLTPVDLGFF